VKRLFGNRTVLSVLDRHMGALSLLAPKKKRANLDFSIYIEAFTSAFLQG